MKALPGIIQGCIVINVLRFKRNHVYRVILKVIRHKFTQYDADFSFPKLEANVYLMCIRNLRIVADFSLFRI